MEMLDQLIPGATPTSSRRWQADRRPVRGDPRSAPAVTGVKAQKNGLKVELEGVRPRMFDQILVAVGRVPTATPIDAAAAGVTVDERGFIPVDAQMRTNVPGIYAIGDIVGGPMLAHKATHEGKVAAEVIAGPRRRFDARAIPSVAYTDPEVAWMGLTETAAQGRRRRVREGRLPLGRLGAGARRWAGTRAYQAAGRAGSRRCWAPGSSGWARAT